MSSAVSSAISGVIPPVVTAIAPGGDVDKASQEAVCQHQLKANVHGLFVAGTTGEGAFLNPAMLADVVDVAVHTAAGQVPVLVGALAPGTQGVVAAARVAERGGADGVVVTTPFYVDVAPEEIVGHFRAVASATALPVLAYSIPPMTHQAMPAQVVEQLFAEDLVVGVKDSGHDWDTLATAIDLGNRYGKAVFSGYEPFAARALAAGGSGVVASVCNVDPQAVVALWEAVQTDPSRGDDAQDRMLSLLAALARHKVAGIGPTSSLIGGIKALLQSFGVIASREVLPPLTALPEHVMHALRRDLES
ncbi:dihydrodipicolinate synthase family protein [Luedemannella helvata]|uniref:Dihydrodipicolinate synthase family protein n=1 Tax=Luedemannella helvata TaxID=349315 RepID=A0ABN2JXT8_9ACTN